jgi:hypothetical protein
MATYVEENTYLWLKQEISDIKTKKFHIVEDSLNDQSIYQLKNNEILPPSYLKFISDFGSARLYRVSNYYKLGVQSHPEEKLLRDIEKVLEFGYFDEDSVCFCYSELRAGFEAPVYEILSNRLSRTAENFEEWLSESCRKAHSSYGKTEWKEILEGPSPFTQEELRIIEERRKFEWKIIGYDENDVVFCIKNKSDLSLPFLTLGVEAKDKSFEGAVRLNVSGINPGHEKLIRRDVYKDLLSPEKLNIYSLPDPTPEERKRYWEFRK